LYSQLPPFCGVFETRNLSRRIISSAAHTVDYRSRELVSANPVLLVADQDPRLLQGAVLCDLIDSSFIQPHIFIAVSFFQFKPGFD